MDSLSSRLYFSQVIAADGKMKQLSLSAAGFADFDAAPSSAPRPQYRKRRRAFFGFAARLLAEEAGHDAAQPRGRISLFTRQLIA